ncbi:MAG: hypothetical protein PVF85_09495 [Anaerolineales bacterium]
MFIHRLRVFGLFCLLSLLIVNAACSVQPQNTDPGDGGERSGDEGALNQNGLSGGAEPGSEGQGGVSGPIALVCPSETTYFRLQLNHNFTFSPGGNKELMQVSGNTLGSSWCLVAVTGAKVKAEPCLVDYEYHGWVQTDGGKCDITGTSTALVEIEGDCALSDPDASGDEGVAEVMLAITEGPDPDADLSGAMNCPNISQPYMGFYPPTFSVMSFLIDDQGSTDVDIDESDISGQFSYHKSWTLTPSR